MKNEKEVTEIGRIMLSSYNKLYEEVGCYALSVEDGKMYFQCATGKLKEWLDKNNLSYNFNYLGSNAYGNGYMVLFAY